MTNITRAPLKSNSRPLIDMQYNEYIIITMSNMPLNELICK